MQVIKTLGIHEGAIIFESRMINLGDQRWVSVVVLFAFLSGCSSYRVPTLSEGRGMPEDEAGDLHVLAVGDEAIVVLQDGSEERGIVIEISPSSIVLGHTGNYGYNETRIQSHAIDSVDLVKVKVHWPLVAVGVVAVVVGTIVGFAESMSHLN